MALLSPSWPIFRLILLGSKLPQNGPQDAPKRLQDGRKRAQRWLKMFPPGPEMAQDGSTRAQDGPNVLKMAQFDPKRARDGHKRAQDGPKMAPSWGKVTIRGLLK